jgi:hypothetical protein
MLLCFIIDCYVCVIESSFFFFFLLLKIMMLTKFS